MRTEKNTNPNILQLLSGGSTAMAALTVEEINDRLFGSMRPDHVYTTADITTRLRNRFQYPIGKQKCTKRELKFLLHNTWHVKKHDQHTARYALPNTHETDVKREILKVMPYKVPVAEDYIADLMKARFQYAYMVVREVLRKMVLGGLIDHIPEICEPDRYVNHAAVDLEDALLHHMQQNTANILEELDCVRLSVNELKESCLRPLKTYEMDCLEVTDPEQLLKVYAKAIKRWRQTVETKIKCITDTIHTVGDEVLEEIRGEIGD
jgi:hypothetical protein